MTEITLGSEEQTKVYSLSDLERDEKKEKDAPAIVRDIPYFNLESVIRAGFPISEKGNGNSGVVIKFGEYAFKLGYGFGFDPDLIDELGRQIYTDNSEEYPTILRIKRDNLRRRLTRDLTVNPFFFERQAGAHVLGHIIKPDLIDTIYGLVTYEDATCGMIMPLYDGKFLSVSDPSLSGISDELNILKEKGIRVDSFQGRKNAVILEDQSVRLFDLDINPRLLIEPLI